MPAARRGGHAAAGPTDPASAAAATATLFLLMAAAPAPACARTVNISNAWVLPQEGFPVFYRYFRDRITWFEADAVCQFHHANLVTVDNSVQFDTTRAYLKELDVVNNVWIGLKKSSPNEQFAWTDYKPLGGGSGAAGGYWLEQSPMAEGALCAALDPAADFRWHSLDCSGPEVASFICELPVPPWARQEDGCMVTALPSLTVTFLPEQAAVELTTDCGFDGTRRVACKGQVDRDEMVHQLSCDQVNSSQEEEASGLEPASNGASSPSSSSNPSSPNSLSVASTGEHVPTSPATVVAHTSPEGDEAGSTATPTSDAATSGATRGASGGPAAVTLAATLPAAVTATTTESPAEAVVEANRGSTSAAATAPPLPPSPAAPRSGHPSAPTHPRASFSWTPEPPTRHRRDAYGPASLASTSEVTELPTAGTATDPSTAGASAATAVSAAPVALAAAAVPAAPARPAQKALPPAPALAPTTTTTTTSPKVAMDETVIRQVELGTVQSALDGAAEATVPEVAVGEVAAISPSAPASPLSVAAAAGAQFSGSKASPTPSAPAAAASKRAAPGAAASVASTPLPTPAARGPAPTQDEDRRRQFLPAPLRAVHTSAPATAVPEWPAAAAAGEKAREEEGEGGIAGGGDSTDDGAAEHLETEPEAPQRPNRGRRLTRPPGHSFYPYLLNRVLG